MPMPASPSSAACPTISCGWEAPRRKEKLVAAINSAKATMVFPCSYANRCVLLLLPSEGSRGLARAFELERAEVFIQTLRGQTIVEQLCRGRRGRRERAKNAGRRYPRPHNNRELALPSGATTLRRCVLDHRNRQPDAAPRANGTVVAALPERGRRRLRPRDVAAAGEDARLQADPAPTATAPQGAAPRRAEYAPATNCGKA